MVDATLQRAGTCGSLFMIPPGVLWHLNETAENIPDAAFQICFESLPRTCRLLCSLEIGRTLFKKRCERFLCFRRAHSRSELFVLDFYRLRDLLAVASSFSSGTTRVTNPISAATFASKGWPNKINSAARMCPLRAGKDQEDPNSGTRPRLTKGN